MIVELAKFLGVSLAEQIDVKFALVTLDKLTELEGDKPGGVKFSPASAAQFIGVLPEICSNFYYEVCASEAEVRRIFPKLTAQEKKRATVAIAAVPAALFLTVTESGPQNDVVMSDVNVELLEPADVAEIPLEEEVEEAQELDDDLVPLEPL